jgi:hypothetical protein
MTDNQENAPVPATSVRGRIRGIFLGGIASTGAIILAVLVMSLGAAYGIVGYKFFSSMLGGKSPGSSGLMLNSFVVGVPFCIGLMVGLLAYRKRLAGAGTTMALTFLALALFVFAAGAFFQEGMICIVLATPIFVAFGLVGTIIGIIAVAIAGSVGSKLLSVALVLPFMVAPFEREMQTPTGRLLTTESIHIDAQPGEVWPQILSPLNIKPLELGDGLAYRMGVPYPVEAITAGGHIGGVRASRWGRGVHFEELLTAWEPGRHIAWTYEFRTDSFPPGSLDDHIAIGGRYFNLESTSYTLEPEGAGTRLTIEVASTVSTNFNWYANLWARPLIADTAAAILRLYKARSESHSSSYGLVSAGGQ